MADQISMSLDDIIKSTKTRGGEGRGRGRGSDTGSDRGRGRGRGRGRDGGAGGAGKSQAPRRPRATAYFEDAHYSNRGYGNGFGQGGGHSQPVQVSLKTGSKLFVSNLDEGVTSEDVEELFGKFGKLKRCGINYNEGGTSRGTAEVMYVRSADATKAISEYNNVSLDGKAMRIEVVTSQAAVMQQRQETVRMMPAGGMMGGRGRGRGFGGEGRGRGRGQERREPREPRERKEKPKREPKETPTVESLDAGMDDYFSAKTAPAATEEA